MISVPGEVTQKPSKTYPGNSKKGIEEVDTLLCGSSQPWSANDHCKPEKL